MSDTIDSSQSSQSVDTGWENWLVRNLWVLKGFLVAAVLAGLGYAGLTLVGHEMGNVLWGIAVTLAVLILLVDAAFAAFRAINSV